jgi:hypothetical protein
MNDSAGGKVEEYETLRCWNAERLPTWHPKQALRIERQPGGDQSEKSASR